MVLVAAVLAALPGGHVKGSSVALDCGGTGRAWVLSGAALRVGLRMDGPWNAGAHGSAEETRRRRVLSTCAKPDVSGVFRWLDRVMGSLRTR